MEIWKRKSNGHWRKRKSRTFASPSTGSLREFLRKIKERKRTSGSRLVVFDSAEMETLLEITRWTTNWRNIETWGEVLNFLELILRPVKYAKPKFISPHPCKEVNGEPVTIRRKIVIAIEIK